MNPLEEYPIKVFISLSIWCDSGEYRNSMEKSSAAKSWILHHLDYPPEYIRTICSVMNYICFRFRNVEDATLFKLTWA